MLYGSALHVISEKFQISFLLMDTSILCETCCIYIINCIALRIMYMQKIGKKVFWKALKTTIRYVFSDIPIMNAF